MDETLYHWSTILVYLDHDKVLNIHFAIQFPFISFSTLNAQRNGVRIAYIDMAEILSNMFDYTKGKEVLDQKVVQWQNEIDEKRWR